MELTLRDRRAFELAWEFLLSLGEPGVTEDIINSYVRPSDSEPPRVTLSQIYKGILSSAQNANMRAGVIGRAIGGFEQLESVLFGFDPTKVLGTYRTWNEVLDVIEEKLKPHGKVRREQRSIWPLYCRTILTAAEFVTRFESGDDFKVWADFFDKDDRARPALPMLISLEIEGVGFPLACDFLKENGYRNFAKPDVHIKDIFTQLGLSRSRNDYEVFSAVVRVARNVGETPYCVDKLFWLIGSGNFYDHSQIGVAGRIGNNKERFYEFARPRLAETT
jgi:hypothetical protein